MTNTTPLMRKTTPLPSWQKSQIITAAIVVLIFLITIVLAMTMVLRYSQGKRVLPFMKKKTKTSKASRSKDVDLEEIPSPRLSALEMASPVMPATPVLRPIEKSDHIGELDLSPPYSRGGGRCGKLVKPQPLLMTVDENGRSELYPAS